MFLSKVHSLGIGTVFYSNGTHFSLFPMTDLHEVGYVIISRVIDYTRKALKLCMHRPKANFDTALVFKYGTLNADNFLMKKQIFSGYEVNWCQFWTGTMRWVNSP